MALLSAYGFDDCANSNDLTYLGFTNIQRTLFAQGTGKFNGNSLTVNNATSQGGLVPVNLPASGNRGIGFYCKVTSNNVAYFGANGASSATSFASLSISTSFIVIMNGVSSAQPVVTVASTIFADAAYHWVEWCVIGGDIVVFVDDLEVLRTPLSNSVFPTQYFYMTSSSSGLFSMDDIISWDASGTAFNTFPIHPQRISYLDPDGIGDSSQFTISGGGATNWESVKKNSYTGSLSQYVTALAVGVTDLYTFTNLPYNPYRVNAIQFKVFAQESGSSSSPLDLQAKSGATQGSVGVVDLPVGANRVLSKFSYTQPAGGAWTFAAVNAAQFGIKS